MTTAIVTTTRTHESKASLIEALKQFAADRDMYQEEIDAKANRIPAERYGEFLESQWYIDRRKNVDHYQRRCDMLAQRIFELSNQELEEADRLEKQIKELQEYNDGLQAELDKARECAINLSILMKTDWYRDRHQLIRVNAERLADLQRQLAAI